MSYLVKSLVVSASDRRVIALGNLAGELKTSLEAAVRAAELELLLTREPARAFVELEREGALAMLVDMATLGAEQFCKRARGTERLRTVPVIGMSRHPNELGFARVFAWGADDLVPLGAVAPLERRLKALRATQRPPDAAGFGQAVVAEATTQRRALVGRVLAQAGYDVKFAVDRGAVELYASQAETRLVVISAALGDPRRIIEAAARAGALPTWIITAEARSVARLASSLLGLDRVAVTSTSGSPEDVLFLANELVFGKGARRREWRALYATPVAFRSLGSDSDEYGFSYDASPGGLYVRSLLPCESDDVEVELRLPNRDERVRLFGKVARRFAFGSGAIASAPPGFSVKLEGPPDDLERWADACQKLIEASSDALTNPPPGGRGEDRISSPPNTESNLAVPPATLTIESVVAPLPAAVLAEVEKGTDVGELLAAALDEQTLAQVGTKPVTMDVHSGDVREERPSEFAIHVPSELLGEADVVAKAPAPEDSTPALGDGPVKLPLPAPASSPSAALAKPAEAAPPAEPPLVDPRFDWDSDAKTAVRQSRPDTEAPVQKSSAEAAAAVRQSRPDTDSAAARRSQPDVEEEAPATRKMVSPEPITRPEMPAAKASAKEPSPAPPPAMTAVVGPLAPPLRAHGRSTMIGVAPPALGSAPAAPGAAPGLGKTQVLPPPRAKAPSSPGISEPRAKLPSSPGIPEPRAKLPSSPGISEPRAAPLPAPAEPASTTAEPEQSGFDDAPPTPTSPQLPEFDSTPIDRDDWALGLEEALSPREGAPAPREVPAAKPLPEYERPSGTAATILAGPGYAPNVPVADAAPYRAAPAPSPPPASRGKSIVIGLFAALALGGGLALVLPKSNSGTTQPSATPTAEAAAPNAPPANTGEAVASGASPTAAPQQEVAPAPASAATANTAPATSAAPPASVANAATAEPPATSAPAASAPDKAAAPAPAQIDFDVRKLPPDRAALYVRSSADTHVFVHGTDYGSTNQVLITTCGIRFVRLGRTLGDFVEPGRSYVIKCGRINQFAIEPAR